MWYLHALPAYVDRYLVMKYLYAQFIYVGIDT